MIPTQINSLRRDLRELDYAIRRCEKRGNIVKADELKTKKTYMMDQLEDLHEMSYCYA